MNSAAKGTQKSTKSTTGSRKKATGFTDEEKAAMRERVKEVKAGEADGERVVLEKIATMSEPDRSIGRRVHAIIMASAPGLVPRLWYGMPAYAKDGHVVCFFQNASKFKTRYSTLGFSDEATLDEGTMWPVAYALKELAAADEPVIARLVKKAVG